MHRMKNFQIKVKTFFLNENQVKNGWQKYLQKIE